MEPLSEPISPELALVDPVLAEAARAALPEEPWKAFIPAPVAPVAAPAPPPPPVVVEEPHEPAAPRRRRSRRLVLTAGFAAAAAAGVLVGGDFIGPRAADRPTFAPSPDAAGTTRTMTAEAQPSPTVKPPVAPAAPPATTAPEPEPQATPKPKPKPKPKPATPARPKKTKAAFVPARIFAWGPVKGATSYRVRFYRGDRVILQRTTKTARIELPRSFAFAKGSYRWIVEPKTGAKYGNAVVDSKFTIP
ncbi:MAG TPA: hypothetical protein VFP31_02390 [Gaiellaceae bacterium]|nr:hypothetical protein [Gaiellaceae bacterium]